MSAPDSEALSRFHPVVQSWFAERFAEPTAPQRSGWPAIASRQDTLIAAPTGSGKTLAAFLACLDQLLRAAIAGRLSDATQVVYVSPLKALSNDIYRNLTQPLEELRAIAARDGIWVAPIRVAVRTGDTPASERAKMSRTPPHILVTTPESLYILLTAERSRAMLSSVKTVIVDEIHAVAGDKRGAHLTLSLERLERLVTGAGGSRPVRVGLSATQRPIELVGRMLVGGGRPAPHIVDAGWARHLDLSIELTDDELGAVASNEQLGRIYDRIAELVTSHQSTLVFVNTRRLVERVSHALEERLGPENVVAHHGSMSREMRLAAEQRLKDGEVRCAVATASLELGIDVGKVDLVVQLGSPRSIATLLQRIGRSGHSLGATPKGRLFPLTRDQLVELAALCRAFEAGRLDALSLRDAPLDILAQQMVAITACEEIAEDELFELCRGAAQYHALDRHHFDQVITMLAEGVGSRHGRVTAHLHRDSTTGTVRARRGARLAAITCGGAIPDLATYAVVEMPSETPVGSLDEDFALESSSGDIFLLGNTSWRILRLEGTRVLVEDAAGMPPTIPFWVGEAPARTAELSDEVGRLRGEVDRDLGEGLPQGDIAARLSQTGSVPTAAAEQLVAYLAASKDALGVLPTQDTIVAERFFDEGGGQQLVLHAPLGGRINKAWGLALRKRFCRGFNFELQAAATDDGIVISLGPVHSFPLADVFEFLGGKTVRELLVQAVLAAPVFGVRWRWNSTRALAVLRRFGGKRVPPQLLRMRTDDLLGLVFPQANACLENVVGDIEPPDHPLINETLRDCLDEFLDADGLEDLIRRLESGQVTIRAVDSIEASPLSHEIINANPYAFLDDVPLEERRTRAVNLPRRLRDVAMGERAPIIEQAAVDSAESAASPDIRSADELHDLLMSMWLVPKPNAAWQSWFDELSGKGRTHTITWTDPTGATRTGWVAIERRDAVIEALGQPGDDSTVLEIVGSHLAYSGPRSPAQLADHFGLPTDRILAALLALESEGSALRVEGYRSDDQDEGPYFCDRRMLARIHRLTLGRLRAEIEPVSPAALMRFLFQWQRTGKGAQLFGRDGLVRILEQLQGYEGAAGAWERDILPARLAGYDPEWLDSLCLSGTVAWARLTPRPIADDMGETPSSSRAPTKAAPLALLLRADLPWLRACAPVAAATDAGLDALAAAVHDHLQRCGASFLVDLASAITDPETDQLALPHRVEEALWQLVTRGLATADGFAGLRVLVDRQRGESRSLFDAGPRPGSPSPRGWARAVKRARDRDRRRPRHALRSLPTSAGRWSLLPVPDPQLADPERAARQLLCRYGVVFRDLLARESCLPPWRDVLMALRRLEARGEIRGGRFVAGFVGEQFASPEAVEALRAHRKAPAQPQVVRIAATDPLNLVGITSGGPRVPAVMGNAVLYRDGSPLASIEGGKLVVRGEMSRGESVDADLTYHPPVTVSLADIQAALPLPEPPMPPSADSSGS